MGLFDFFNKKTTPPKEVSLYFINGCLKTVLPESTEDFYDCDYVYSDGVKFDMANAESIKSIPVPEFQMVDSFSKYGATGSLDYVIRMKAGKYFNSENKELCSACLWKCTELMLANKFFAWRKEDYERLVIWHYELKMFSEGEKAKKYLEQHNVYDNQFDSIAISIKDSIFKSLKQFNSELVVFHGYKGGCCAECAKMIGRVYSINGKNKQFPKLPEYTKIHGNFHSGCRCTMSAYIEEMGHIFHKGEEVDPITSSNRPWIDDRTEQEISNYQDYLNLLAEADRKGKDRDEYNIILKKLPNIAPKSFGAYRRMKNSKTKNFEKLLESAKQVGIEIES